MTGCLIEAAKARGRARIRGLTPPPETTDDRILRRWAGVLARMAQQEFVA